MINNSFFEWALGCFPDAVCSGSSVVIGGVSIQFVDLNDDAAVDALTIAAKGRDGRGFLFSDEWERRSEQWKSVLRAQAGIFERRLGARECEVKQVNQVDGHEFLDSHHIQGSNRLSLVYFGLYSGDELLGLLSLGRHNRHTVNNLTLLDRLCFKSGVQVVGGASKLLKVAVDWARGQEFDEIVSFSDNRWSDGKSYEAIGFTLESTLKSDYFYVKDGRRISKQSQKKSNTGCPETMTEFEWATMNGLRRCFDLGKKRWIYNLWPGEHETKKEIRSRRCAERQRDGDFHTSRIRGHFSSKKSGQIVHFASSYELRCMSLLDCDDKVLSFRRCDTFKAEDGWRAPDLWIDFVDGHSEIWEVKPSSTLELPEIKKQISDSEIFCASKGVSFKVWTEKDSGLGDDHGLVSWAKEWLSRNHGDDSWKKRTKEMSRLKAKRHRDRQSKDRISIWCEPCKETHDIRRVTYDKNVKKNGEYLCKSQACAISGRVAKPALWSVNQFENEGKKKCSSCGDVLSVDAFRKKKSKRDGVDTLCVRCRNERGRVWGAKDRQRKVIELEQQGKKQCWKCKLVFPLSEFGPKFASRDGLSAACNKCAVFQRHATT